MHAEIEEVNGHCIWEEIKSTADVPSASAAIRRGGRKLPSCDTPKVEARQACPYLSPRHGERRF